MNPNNEPQIYQIKTFPKKIKIHTQNLSKINLQQQNKNNHENNEALLYDPSKYQKQQFITQSQNYIPGMIIQLKTIKLNLHLHKNPSKITAFMMTSENLTKIHTELFDPNLETTINLSIQDSQIINHFNRPRKNKQQYLIGWFQSNSQSNNQSIKKFAQQCDDRKKIYAVKNSYATMHIMSILQYTKIINFYQIPNKVAYQCSKNILNQNRLIFILQYTLITTENILYQNWNEIDIKYESYDVEIPDVVIIDQKYRMQSKKDKKLSKEQLHKESHNNRTIPNQYQSWKFNEKQNKSFKQSSTSSHPLSPIDKFSSIRADEDKMTKKSKEKKTKTITK